MVSTQNKQMAQFFASMTERMSGSDLDLATIRDVYENLHLAAREPEKDGGSIILNGSVASVKGTAAFSVYALSKAAIRSFARTWTTDLKDRRVRADVVNPGPINTPWVSRQSPDVIARIVSTVPMGRMGEPDQVAKAALFLASDDASFVTGIELFVDSAGRRSNRFRVVAAADPL